MLHAEVRISDATAAVSAFGALSRLSGSAKIPSDQREFTQRISRISGRARNLAVALNKYVETHGFDAFRSALEVDRSVMGTSAEFKRTDAEAAATVSIINFEELERTAMTFAASGLY